MYKIQLQITEECKNLSAGIGVFAYELKCSNYIVGIEKLSKVHQPLAPFFFLVLRDVFV